MPAGLGLGPWVLPAECCRVLQLFLPWVALVLVPEILAVVPLVLLWLRFLGRGVARHRIL